MAGAAPFKAVARENRTSARYLVEMPTAPQDEQREVFIGPTKLLPELPMVGYDVFKAAGNLPGHVHKDDFEICLIVTGSVDWWAGDRLYEVHGGDLYVTRPGESHGGQNAVMNPCTLYWFHVRFSRKQPLPGMTVAQSNFLFKRLSTLTLQSFKSSPATAAACERLHAVHRTRDTLSTIAARGVLHELIAGVVRDHDAAQQRRLDRTPRVLEAMAFMREHLGEPYRVEDVAAAVGLNVGNLHAQFLKEVGLTPGDWRTRQVMRRAKTMLGDPKQTVTDVAMALGFSSSQYFATAFRRVIGLTPRAYRERLRSNNAIVPV